MLGRSVGIVAASALGASAFLIPTGLVNEQAAELIAPSGRSAKQSIVQLPCSECVFSAKQKEGTEDIKDVEQTEEEFWIQGGANSIIVNVTISEDGKKLEINGETIYPLGSALDSLMAPRTYVSQVASSASVEDIESGNAKVTPVEVTGSGVSIQDVMANTEDGQSLIPIKHTIFELERQPVSLDEILIQVLKNADEELFLVHVSTEQHHAPRPMDFFGPPRGDREGDFLSIMPHPHHEGHEGHKGQHHGPPHGSERECKNLPASLCKLKHMIEEKFMGMRQGHGHGFKMGGFKKGGCHGMKGNKKGGRPHDGKLPSHIRPHFMRIGKDGDDTPRHHGRPHHMHHDGHHHGHHKHHFMHSFSRGLTAVLIPTMMGVAVGMVVSLFGLCIGRMISYLWIKLYRGGRRGYESVRLEEEDIVEEADLEKKTFIVLEQSEPLPVYEEAPSYEEAQHEQK